MGEALTEKWGTGMYGNEDPLFTPFWVFTRLQFQPFQFQDPMFVPKAHISRNFQLQTLKIGKELHSKASN